MSIKVAAIIFVFASVLALLIAAPWIYLLRRSRRRQKLRPQTIATQSLNWKQAVPGLILAAVLFFAYAAEYIAPESWLGLRVRTLEGKFWLFVLLWLVLYSIERIVRRLASKNVKGDGPR